jgi:CheY-like chemotaxis protein
MHGLFRLCSVSLLTGLVVILLLGIVGPVSYAEPTPPPGGPDTQAAAVHDYTELLKTEAQGLREAAENDAKRIDHALSIFTWIVSVVSAILVVGAGAVGWTLALASRTNVRDIKREVSEQLRASVEAEIKSGIDQIVGPALEELKRTTAEKVNVVRNELADVRTGIVEAAADSVFHRATAGITSAEDRTATAPRSLAARRIIWVDDQPNTTKAARAELEKLGINVDAVTSSEALEEKLRTGKNYDLIVSDMRRNGNPRAGLDYFQKIRNDADLNSKLPPRLLFAPQSLVGKYRSDIDKLVEDHSGKFLSPVTSPERFFSTVLQIFSDT